MTDPREENMPDQALINQQILSQLDMIGKILTIIENKSDSPAQSKAKKLTKNEACCKFKISSISSVEEDDSNMPNLHTLWNDTSRFPCVSVRPGPFLIIFYEFLK